MCGFFFAPAASSADVENGVRGDLRWRGWIGLIWRPSSLADEETELGRVRDGEVGGVASGSFGIAGEQE